MSQNRIHPTLKHPVTGLPLEAVGIVHGRPVWPILGGAPDDGGDGGDGGDGKGGDGKTFTQADLDAAVTKAAARIREDERKKVSAKFADYDELKAKAEQGKTVEEQLASMREQLTQTQRAALRSKVQARFGISDEDAALFLTSDDEDTLVKAATRLKEQAEAKSNNGGRVPGEGRNGRPKITDEKQAVRTLFGTPA